MIILDGKAWSKEILQQLKLQIAEQLSENVILVPPRLDIILIGDDFASQKYVELKQATAKEIGIECVIHKLDSFAEKPEIIKLIEILNKDSRVTGIMVQLPLPNRKIEEEVLEAISPSKDADGLTATNLGRLFQNCANVFYTAPATAIAVMSLLNNYNISIKSKNIVVLGASKVVGLPIAGLFINAGGTVTVCHDLTTNEHEITRTADILISCTGVAGLIKKDWVKDGAVVVDVGYSKDIKSGQVLGDVDFENVAHKCSYISKVFGGVGPMTVACLMRNTVSLWNRSD